MEDEHKSRKRLATIGFNIIDKTIYLTDDLPIFSRLVRNEIDYLCLDHGYECSFIHDITE